MAQEIVEAEDGIKSRNTCNNTRTCISFQEDKSSTRSNLYTHLEKLSTFSYGVVDF